MGNAPVTGKLKEVIIRNLPENVKPINPRGNHSFDTCHPFVYEGGKCGCDRPGRTVTFRKGFSSLDPAAFDKMLREEEPARS